MWEENSGVALPFSTVCFQMIPVWEDAKSHYWCHFKYGFLHCIFKLSEDEDEDSTKGDGGVGGELRCR